MKKKMSLWIYLLLVFVLSWAYMFAIVYPAAKGGNALRKRSWGSRPGR